MTYEHKDPIQNGYRRVNLSRTDHNRLFPSRRTGWQHSFEYYLSETDFLLLRFVSLPAIAVNVILFPVLLVVHGVANRSLWRELFDLFRQKASGSFSSDKVWARSNSFADIVKAVKP